MPAVRNKQLDALLAQLYETPEDWTLRLVIADAFEESGDTMSAECLRWMAANKKQALGGESNDGEECCSWYDETTAGELGLISQDGWDIPSPLWEELTQWQIPPGYERFRKDYATVRHSEYALRVAWRKARGKGWKPD